MRVNTGVRVNTAGHAVVSSILLPAAFPEGIRRAFLPAEGNPYQKLASLQIPQNVTESKHKVGTPWGLSG